MSRRTRLAARSIMQATQIIGPFGGGPKKWQNRIQTMPTDKAQAEEVLQRNARTDQWAPKPEKLKRLAKTLYTRRTR